MMHDGKKNMHSLAGSLVRSFMHLVGHLNQHPQAHKVKMAFIETFTMRDTHTKNHDDDKD